MPNQERHDGDERSPAQRTQQRVDALALLAVMVLIFTVAAGLWRWQAWLDQRDSTSHAWWLEHSEPLRSSETVERVVVGQMSYHGIPFDAWARAETAHTVVIRSLRAVGCGDSSVSFTGRDRHTMDDVQRVRILQGQSLHGVEARVLLASGDGDSEDPPCPTLSLENGRWTFEGKTIAVLNPGHGRLR